jgi:hypothetical protein
MEWEPFEVVPGMYRKVLERDADGNAVMQLTFLPPGFTLPELPYRHRHRTLHEYGITLWGELPHWEYESAEQQGVNVYRRAGFFMHRLPGSIHGLEEGPLSPTGSVALSWRTGPGSWIGEAEFERETERIPYGA